MSNPAKPPERSPIVAAAANAASVTTLLTLSLVTHEYIRILEPLYATAPVQYHLNKVIWSAVILSSLVPTLPKASILVAGILITVLPTSAYWVAAYTARNHDVIWGPVITHLSVLAPILYLGVGVSKLFHDTTNGGAPSGAQVMSLPVSGMALTGLRELWTAIPFIRDADETLILTWVGGFAITLWLVSPFLNQEVPPPPASSTPEKQEKETPTPQNRRERRQLAKVEAAEAKKKKSTASPSPAPTPDEPPKPKETQADFAKKHGWRVTILPIIPLLATFVKPPVLPKPLHHPYVHPSAPLQVLSSVRSSYSGIVLVGEVLPPTPEQVAVGNVSEPHSMRYLRAGHSLLGGVWIGDRVYTRDGTGPLQFDSEGKAIGDSIYGTFNMQEAVKLIGPETGETKNALIIGLGAGISASAFMRQNISTTIVEIDPAVYEAAEKYFALPKPEAGHLFLEDARGWVFNRRRLLNSPEDSSEAETKPEEIPLFDYVIHDCFSGGGVPSHIFTLAFWEDLKAIMAPTASIAINFAGHLSSDSSRAVATTLKQAFGQCRVFHDSMDPVTEEMLANDFMNWVFFCTPSSDPVVFRDATEADYLSSYLREQVFLTLPDREVPLERFLQDVKESDVQKYTLTDANNPLSGWQEKDALHHWAVMRKVLNDVFWETY